MVINAYRPKVLFFGLTDYDLAVDNAVLAKKFIGLGRDMEVFVLARGRGQTKKYGARFFLIPKIFGKIGVPLWLLRALILGNQIIKQEKIDILIAQSPAWDGLVAALLKIFTGRKLVVEVHGDWVSAPFYYHRIPLAGLIRKVLEKLGQFSLRRADKIRVISSATEKQARQYAPDKPFCKFPTFTDLDIFADKTAISYEPIILYVGWLYRLKGVQFLLAAFASIKNRFPAYKLVVAGDGPYRPELEKLAHKLQISGQLEFTGRLLLSGVKDLMRRASVIVLPSLSEGLGRVLIEGAMSRKSLIGSNVGGIPDIIQDGENGLLFRPGDEFDLAEKLEMILSNPEGAKEMGEKGRAIVSGRFSNEKFFAGYRALIAD